MIEVKGNLWHWTPEGRKVDARVITTNGTVKNNGRCVMGRGCAYEASQKWPNFPAMLGAHLQEVGNVPKVFVPQPDVVVVSMPVKHQWYDKADVKLIQQSARLLRLITGANKWQVVVLPQPGCGNGKLSWEGTVRPALAEILDDRFYVITW